MTLSDYEGYWNKAHSPPQQNKKKNAGTWTN
jgi:hypothetical protein